MVNFGYVLNTGSLIKKRENSMNYSVDYTTPTLPAQWEKNVFTMKTIETAEPLWNLFKVKNKKSQRCPW